MGQEGSSTAGGGTAGISTSDGRHGDAGATRVRPTGVAPPTSAAAPLAGGGVFSPPPVDWDSMFVWNSFLTRALREALGGDQWVLPLVHGYFEQRVCTGACFCAWTWVLEGRRSIPGMASLQLLAVTMLDLPRENG